MKKITALILALLLTLSLTCLFSCDKETPDTDNTDQTGNTDQAPTPWDGATYKESATVGEGSKTFTVEICAYDKSITLTVKTDASTVGDALSALNLIEGEAGAYGLYVKKVNGVLADYDVDATYWAFYINGEYASSGVDTTNLVNGTTYKMSRAK